VDDHALPLRGWLWTAAGPPIVDGLRSPTGGPGTGGSGWDTPGDGAPRRVRVGQARAGSGRVGHTWSGWGTPGPDRVGGEDVA
jgi:hypothetical protein